MSNSSPQGPLVILGDALIGEKLVARPNGVSDADGINFSTQSFQWLRDGQPIFGATNQTYFVSSSDAGSRISVEYSYTDGGGTRETVVSNPEPAVPSTGSGGGAPTGPVIIPDSDPGNSVGDLLILGEALVGEKLVARPNGVTDPDGINYATQTFQWLRNGEPIFGATGQFYEVGVADQGTQISVQWSYFDFSGVQQTLVSDPEPTVPGGTPTPPPPPPPTTPTVPTEPTVPTTPTEPVTPPPTPEPPAEFVNSVPIGLFYILGFPREGTTMIARTDSVFDRDGFDPDTATFQWLRDGEPIPGATDVSYVVSVEDRGAALSVQMSYVDGMGTLETIVTDEEPPVPFPAGEEPEPIVDSGGGSEPRSSGVLTGTEDNDILTATAEFGRIDGLEGDDIALFAGELTDYTLTFSPDGVTVTDRTTDGLGTIELDNIERIGFDTGLPVFGDAVDLTQFGGHAGLDADAFESFVEMYIAYFNRAPDAIGLAFWGTAYANGMSLEAIANEFANQPETLIVYPEDVSNIRFVADVYENVFGRAPDIDGLRFWTDALNEGEVGRSEFIMTLLGGVQDGSADRAYLDQKTDLGAYFAVHKGMSNTDDAADVLALFDGTGGSVQTVVDAIDALYAASLDAENGDFLMPLVGVLDDPFAL
ncbi:DUF4214 domain-containing protein [Marivita hallyeonensis]|uniref:DUF4214 domain-containing protein n=1 Tax=Marivita hallyeonensis TaxID=996342 RepID=A0A1M5Y3Y6_9RHOB|nr:DUF4214 domain-containing protein [Marivita hallyeonensis]SHI06781.1 protein of unknown function [Marivita hallyeonensis]